MVKPVQQPPADDDGEKSLSLVSPSSSDFLPKKGERALSIGQTGSGKTTFNCWLLERLEDAPILIYDTKHDPKFEKLAGSRVVHTVGGIEDALDDLSVDYVVMRPPPSVTASPQALDSLLSYHEEHWRGVDAYIDELYHFHKGGYAGPGLNGLYTRGRSRGITTIGSTQRPAWVSGFVFSETQLFYIFPIYQKKDKKKVDDFIDGFVDLVTPDAHHFYLFRQGVRSIPKLMKPVPVAPGKDLGYTDHEKRPDAAESDVVEETLDPANVWI